VRLALTIFFLILNGSAWAQSLDETVLFLLFPGHSDEMLSGGKPYTLKRAPVPANNTQATIIMTLKDNCTAEIVTDNLDDSLGNAKRTRRTERLDLSRATVLDFSGEDWTGVTIRGSKGLSCYHFEDSAEKCTDFAFPEHFGSLMVFANHTDKQFRSYVQARYEKAFAYYRQEFCKGRAF
jgi:hypothetical protein